MAPIEALRVPFGFERSCKIGPGRIAPDRCLVSLARASLGLSDAASLARLEDLARGLGLPAAALPWLRRHLRGASHVHVGFEAGAEALVHKLYLEDSDAARAPPDAPVTVHRALKWTPGAAAVTETHYVLEPGQGRSLDARLAAEARAPLLTPIVEAARLLLRRALARAGEGDLMLLHVADLGSPRRSFDLMVYDADLAMAAVGDVLAILEEAFTLDAAALRDALGPASRVRLGHLAGGLDRAQAPFATLYFGACRR